MAPAIPIATEVPASTHVGAPLVACEMTKAGERVMLLEAFGEPDGQVTVAAEVRPVHARDLQHPIRSAYRFATTSAAMRFVEEAVTAMEYLGCTMVDHMTADPA